MLSFSAQRKPRAHLKPPVAIHCPNIARQVPKFLLISQTFAMLSHPLCCFDCYRLARPLVDLSKWRTKLHKRNVTPKIKPTRNTEVKFFPPFVASVTVSQAECSLNQRCTRWKITFYNILLSHRCLLLCVWLQSVSYLLASKTPELNKDQAGQGREQETGSQLNLMWIHRMEK